VAQAQAMRATFGWLFFKRWTVMTTSQESHVRTHAFARFMGPWLVIAPGIIAARAASMGKLASEFFQSDLCVWFAGALLLFLGLLIIAFHQYWRSLAGALISAFGWILLLRGLVLMTAPDWYERATFALDSVLLIRIMFGVIMVIGLYLTYVGWFTRRLA
jgi:uncharacterized protein YjeT (DUF2065 family)